MKLAMVMVIITSYLQAFVFTRVFIFLVSLISLTEELYESIVYTQYRAYADG
jgi:hypothetical protein